mmetsp:Transcript_23857/g.46778  ORF Transcript_23857/g.46778 Transcript_23857/m.46778 type:complete len:202 (-) Transcript_23857:166-771(-)
MEWMAHSLYSSEHDFLDKAKWGDLKGVRKQVKWGVDIHAKDSGGKTALHLAALKDRVAVIKYLAEEERADVNLTDNDGDTPLHMAAMRSTDNALKLLVDSKASVDVRNNFGETPLHLAIRHGMENSVKFLVEEGCADVNIGLERSPNAPDYYDFDTTRTRLRIGAFLEEVRKDRFMTPVKRDLQPLEPLFPEIFNAVYQRG